VGGDFARRFVASAAESGIDVFRLEDPLNDVENLREAGEAIVAAEREFDAGLIYSPGRGGETKPLVEQAKKLPELGAARVLLHDPSGALEPHRANELVAALAEGSGLVVVSCRTVSHFLRSALVKLPVWGASELGYKSPWTFR
jgi:pyruvate/oxaloacetate carboxyltransferase